MARTKKGKRNLQQRKPLAKQKARKPDRQGGSNKVAQGSPNHRWARGPNQHSKWGLHKNVIKASAAATGAAPAPSASPGKKASKSDSPQAQVGQAHSGNTSSEKGGKKLTKLQAMMKSKMDSAKFRWLNEKLYSTTSDNAFAFYKKAPENWRVYHHGYRSQVKSWPKNPLYVIADVLRAHPGWVVGDFGCGDAELSTLLPQNKVHSFDLVAANDNVVACDMKRVPLKASTLDAAVYCLSLMGTNVKDFLLEARRTLRVGGTLLIAEVASRINSGGAASNKKKKESSAAGTDGFAQFIQEMGLLGFDLRSKDLSNSVFCVFQFQRTKREPDTLRFTWSFEPWVYKKR